MITQKYANMSQDLMDNGWTINFKFEKNKCQAWVCHETWLTKNLYAGYTLPQFDGEDMEDACSQIHEYFYK